MRGKKVDTEFVSNFICNCVANNKSSSKDICQEATNQIQIIDNKIKEVEILKKTRPKLQDVIFSLDKKDLNKSKDKNILNFYEISNLPLAHNFCMNLNCSNGLEISSLTSNDMLMMKKLLSINILKKENNKIIPGENFQEFLDFYNRNYNYEFIHE